MGQTKRFMALALGALLLTGVTGCGTSVTAVSDAAPSGDAVPRSSSSASPLSGGASDSECSAFAGEAQVAATKYQSGSVQAVMDRAIAAGCDFPPPAVKWNPNAAQIKDALKGDCEELETLLSSGLPAVGKALQRVLDLRSASTVKQIKNSRDFSTIEGALGTAPESAYRLAEKSLADLDFAKPEQFRNEYLKAAAKTCGLVRELEDLRAKSASGLAELRTLKAIVKEYTDGTFYDGHTDSCLSMVSVENGEPREGNSIWWWQEYLGTSYGDLYMTWNLVNYCGRPIQGFKYSLTITDAFGDIVFSGNGDNVFKRVPPGGVIKLDKNDVGRFELVGDDWSRLMSWWDAPDTDVRGWVVKITQILYG